MLPLLLLLPVGLLLPLLLLLLVLLLLLLLLRLLLVLLLLLFSLPCTHAQLTPVLLFIWANKGVVLVRHKPALGWCAAKLVNVPDFLSPLVG
jgi:hypothetical protein